MALPLAEMKRKPALATASALCFAMAGTVGCTWLDYHSPANNDEANFWRTAAAIKLGKPVRHDLYPYDNGAMQALQGKRIASPGIRMLAKTPQGASVDRSNMHDMLSTAVALNVQEAAVEANPLSWALIPLKVAMGRFIIDPMSCIQRVRASEIVNSVFHGAAMNNWALALTGATAEITIPIGIAAGGVYYIYRTSIEPGVYTCGQSEEY